MDIRLLAPTMTLLGIFVSIFLWRLNWRKKELSFAILWHNPLLNLKGQARDQLNIHFKGQKVSNADLIVVRIFNSGHLPINMSDYQTNLIVQVNAGAKILDVNVIDTAPADLEERLKISDAKHSFVEKVEEAKVFLRPILLNESDSLTLQLLVLNARGKVSVTGHVQGLKRIRPWRESRLVPRLLTQCGAIIMALAMLGVQPGDLVSLAFEHVLPYLLTFLLGYVCLSAGMYWPHKQNLA